MSQWWQIVISVLVSIFGSSGLWAVIQYKMEQKDTTHATLEEIKHSIRVVDEKVDRSEAKTARDKILTFADECENGQHHGRDSFRNVLEETIPMYERYCESHKDFRNGYADAAIKLIKTTYETLIAEHKFSGGDQA